ncbi:hypothetical protein GOODEAATRI_010603 [Goodea atripinnis]|uniref:Uncharacterized protein n=1 Tax=Goodea atripinnis TaxID=208336 RepID=A0ABV0MQZ8_9TELE
MGAHHKGPLQALNCRTPKLLVPLDGRPRDGKALPSLKPHVPLKPISRSPHSTRTKLRKERLSWGSPCNGPSKAGSEESGSSSSSQSSINLEKEDDDDGQIQETYFKDRNLFVKDGTVLHSNDRIASEANVSAEKTLHANVKARMCSLVNSSIHDRERDRVKCTNHLRVEKAECSKYEANNTNHPKDAIKSESLKEFNYSQKVEPLGPTDFESNEKSDASMFSDDKSNMSSTDESKTGISNKITKDVRDLQDDATGCFEENYENEQMNSDHTEPTRNVCGDQENRAKQVRACSADTAVEKTGFFPVDPKKYEKMFKARNKESKTRMNCHLKANNSTIHSLNYDPRISGDNHSKINLKYSAVSAVVKDKSKKSPELSIARDANLAKVKLKIKSGNASFNTQSSSRLKAEVGTSKECSHKSSEDECEDHILSTIVEALSKDGSETLQPDDKILSGPTTSIYGVDSAKQDPELTQSVNPQQPKMNTWTSSGSSCHTLMSPVYKKFLDEVGEGPLTDDLLQCLAEELISLDERDISTPPENSEQGKKEFHGEEELVSGQNTFPEVIF